MISVNTDVVALAVSAVGAVVGAIFGYLRYRRKTSGSIGTTDAAQLWDEAKALREELGREIRELRGAAKEAAHERETMRIEHATITARMSLIEQAANECKEREAVLAQRVMELEGAR